ncbi:hypothetical protein BH20VER2_BH20VER2_01320 [soil metagenome]
MAGVGARPSKAELAKQQAQGAGAQTTTARVSESDRKFLFDAFAGAAKQVQLGEIATRRGQSEQVRKLGSRMVADHGRLFGELSAEAARKGLKLVGRPFGEKLKDRANFDRAWLAVALDHHQKQVAIFQRQARSGTEADLRRLAQRALSILEQHTKLAQAAQQSVGRSETAGANRVGSGSGRSRR